MYKRQPYGIAEIEDFSGKTELRLFGRTYETFQPLLVEGAAVYVTINYKPDRFKPDTVRMNIESVEPLERYEGNLVNVARFDISDDFHDKGFREELMKYKSTNGKGGTVYLRVLDRKSRQWIELRSRIRFRFTKEFADTFSNWPTVMKTSFSHEKA